MSAKAREYLDFWIDRASDQDREEPLIAALLILRFLYYLMPFVLALALFGAVEGWQGLRAKA